MLGLRTPRAKMIEAWTLSSIEPSLLTWVSLVMVGMQTSPILLDVRKSTWSTRSYWLNPLNHSCPLQIQQRVMSSISFKSSTAICHSPAFSQAEIAALKQMTSGDTCRIVESWSFWGDPWKQEFRNSLRVGNSTESKSKKLVHHGAWIRNEPFVVSCVDTVAGDWIGYLSSLPRLGPQTLNLNFDDVGV